MQVAPARPLAGHAAADAVMGVPPLALHRGLGLHRGGARRSLSPAKERL
jgi:hypothetical protein